MKTSSTKPILRYSLIIAFTAIALLYVVFCVYYMGSSHQKLLTDFDKMSGGCFYRLANFQSKMFTPDTKWSGNIYCLLAIPCVFVFVYALYKDLLNTSIWKKLRAFSFSVRHTAGWVIALLFFCLGAAYFGHAQQTMCSDEAFSAFNFASKPIAHLISYYPIPNNHIFFNFLNHFAALIVGNPLLSGRILAAIFYSLLIIGNFFLFRYFSRNNFLSFLCCILLSLQFMIYGFGHQARGYSLYYLLYWGSLVALYGYFFHNGKSKREALLVLLGCNILGLWTIPVFVYAIIVQLIAALISMVSKKRFDWPFVRMILLSGIGTFLVYLPLLSYSGLSAIVPKSKGESQSFFEIFKDFPGYFLRKALEHFESLFNSTTIILSVFLVPICLFLIFRQRLQKLRPLLWFYVWSWLAVVLMALFVQQFPFYRILGIQMHISLAILLLSIAVLIANAGKLRTVWLGCFSIIFVIAAIGMVRFNKKYEDTDLYGQNPNEFMKGLQTMPIDFPKSASIWLSDESFMWHFLLKDYKNVQNYDCNFNNQDFLFLSEDDKPLPDNIMQHYKEKSRASWFVVYQRVE